MERSVWGSPYTQPAPTFTYLSGYVALLVFLISYAASSGLVRWVRLFFSKVFLKRNLFNFFFS